jgi:capsule synthesis protein PGA_cap
VIGQRRTSAAAICGALAVLLLAGDTAVGGAARAAGVPIAQREAAPSTVSTTTTSTAPPPPPSFTLVAGGDVLLHSPLWDQAAADAAAAGHPGYDFAPMLSGIEPVVGGADLAICHLETPLAPPEGPFAGYPAFSAPPQIADGLAATGFDACSTASNHVFDRGGDGVDRTLATLDAAGLQHAGSARTPAEAGSTTLLDAGEADVALLSYTFGTNGVPAPDGQAWRTNLIDEARILADAATARRRGAEVVVVALHWGNEYQPEPSEQQAALAPRLIASPDVDLLLGHHAHVVQPVASSGGEWVVYGMGNLLAHQGTLGPEKEEGLLVRFAFTETSPGHWETTGAEYTVALTQRGASPVRVVDVHRQLADPSLPPASRQRDQEAWDRSTAVVTQRGAADAGLRPLA